MSANTVCAFLQKLGQDGGRRRSFYQKRAAAVIASHHVAIDGTLKQDGSTVNDLSAFSYKAGQKGCREVSVLYAYDIEAMEPACAEVFPGNSIDASSYAAFIRDNDIRKGSIVSDKGFPPSQIKKGLDKRPDLHFLTPIKRNDVRIANNGSSLSRVCPLALMTMSCTRNAPFRAAVIFTPTGLPEKLPQRKLLT